MGVIFKMYAGGADGIFPRMHADEAWGDDPPSSCDNTISEADYAPDMVSLIPDYLTDPSILICPSDPEAGEDNLGLVESEPGQDCSYAGLISNADVSYVYFGYVLDKVEDIDPTADIGGLIPDIEGVVNSQIAYMTASLLYENSLNPGGVVGDDDPNNDVELDKDITPGNPTSLAYNIVSGLSQPPGEPFGNGDTDTVYRLR